MRRHASTFFQILFVGIEVHEPCVGYWLLHAEAAGISNLRLIRHDAIDVMRQQIPDASLRRINLYLPDPWPKKRHHKRRILQHDFLQLASRKLEPGGTFHIATDNVIVVHLQSEFTSISLLKILNELPRNRASRYR